jgi:hypothetical protein
MSGAIPPLPQYAFMAWCSVKAQGQLYLLLDDDDNNNNEKIQNYLPLAEEIKSAWKLNSVIIVPIIIFATGVIPKSLHRSIATLHLDPNIYILLQKTVVINTATIVRRFLNN